MITGRQICEARALLGWMRSDLAAELGMVGTPSLKRIEMFEGPPPIRKEHAAAIRRALERAGIEFIADDDGTPTVRLREPDPT